MSFLKREPKPIVGIDEAGRGTWAGPVYVSAVVLDPNNPVDGLADSKIMKPAQREKVYADIMAKALYVATAAMDSQTIDDINIYQAVMRGMARVANDVSRKAGKRLNDFDIQIDGSELPDPLKGYAKTIVKGDSLIPAISAASIVAKVERDRLMMELDEEFPGYGFAKHKGYGTKDHRNALTELGPCAIHRMSFRPMKEMKRGLMI